MKETMRYITIEERKFYEEVASQCNIKGYTPPNSLVCRSPSSELKLDFLKTAKKEKKNR